MTHLSNLRRDMFWSQEGSGLTAAAASSAWSASFVMNADNVTYDRHGHFQTGRLSLAGTANEWVAFGVFMDWDIDAGSVPFRFKGVANHQEALWFTGWALTGTQRTIGDNVFHGAGKSIDEIVCVRQNSSYQAHQCAFGCAVPADGGDVMVGGHVQRLLGQPDQYSASVY